MHAWDGNIQVHVGMHASVVTTCCMQPAAARLAREVLYACGVVVFIDIENEVFYRESGDDPL